MYTNWKQMILNFSMSLKIPMKNFGQNFTSYTYSIPKTVSNGT